MNKWIIRVAVAVSCVISFSAAASTESAKLGVVLAISEQKSNENVAGARGAAIGAAIGGLIAYKSGGSSYGSRYRRSSAGALVGGAVGAAVDRRAGSHGYSVVIRDEAGKMVSITTRRRPMVGIGTIVFFTRSGHITPAPETGGLQ